MENERPVVEVSSFDKHPTENSRDSPGILRGTRKEFERNLKGACEGLETFLKGSCEVSVLNFGARWPEGLGDILDLIL